MIGLSCFLFIIAMGALARMAGTGWGAKWGFSPLPEILYCLPFGVGFAMISMYFGLPSNLGIGALLIGWGISYAGMQSATWMFLDWEGENQPNFNRSSTLKPIIDWLADLFGCRLGDEGYAWTAAAVKGFIIGLPVGGVLTAILWPLGYEIGSHAKGRSHRIGIKDPHAVSEFMSGALGAISILLSVWIVQTVFKPV